jgi:hypothetical protein
LVLLISSVTAAMQSPASDVTAQPDVVASVAGRSITRAEVDDVWRAKDPSTYFRFLQQRHEITMHVVREILADSLLQREAGMRGTTVEALVAAEVVRRVTPPSEAVLKTEFERMQGAFPSLSFAEARPIVERAVGQQRAADARAAFIDGLFERSRDLIVIYDKAPRQAVAVGGSDPVAGLQTLR